MNVDTGENDEPSRDVNDKLKPTDDDDTAAATDAAYNDSDDSDADEGCVSCLVSDACSVSSSYCDCNTDRQLQVKP